MREYNSLGRDLLRRYDNNSSRYNLIWGSRGVVQNNIRRFESYLATPMRQPEVRHADRSESSIDRDNRRLRVLKQLEDKVEGLNNTIETLSESIHQMELILVFNMNHYKDKGLDSDLAEEGSGDSEGDANEDLGLSKHYEFAEDESLTWLETKYSRQIGNFENLRDLRKQQKNIWSAIENNQGVSNWRSALEDLEEMVESIGDILSRLETRRDLVKKEIDRRASDLDDSTEEKEESILVEAI